MAEQRSPAPALRYLRDRAWGPWFDTHLDLRYKEDELNPVGWRAHYRRAASLLRQWPDIRGIYAESWLFDPALHEVSPNLAFYHAIPAEGGAHYVFVGITPADVVRATMTSRRRAELVISGEWAPRTHIKLWPRAQLLAWADRQTGPL